MKELRESERACARATASKSNRVGLKEANLE